MRRWWVGALLVGVLASAVGQENASTTTPSSAVVETDDSNGTTAVESTTTPAPSSTVLHTQEDDNDDDDDDEVRFNDLNSMVLLVVFLVATWHAGKAAAVFGVPGLVGELACGAALGPPGLDVVPFARGLRIVGNVGLCLLFVEAGLEVDAEMLEIVGARGLAVGLAGTLGPMLLAAGCVQAWGGTFREAAVAGAALSTMSTGISLNVLKAGKALNRPVGQLVIAAATCNEILGIILLMQIQNLVRGADEWYFYVAPALALIFASLLVGYLAVSVVPRLLDKVLLPRVPRKRRSDALLALVFLTALCLVPATAYAGASPLLGAFLAGLCFCSDHAAHVVWERQVKRLLRWLLRVFFAATVGFTIPVGHLLDPTALARAAVFLLVAFPGKLAVGALAAPRAALTAETFWTVAYAWGSWGEVAFVVLDVGRDAIPEATANAVVVAVVASVVLAPWRLRAVLLRAAKTARDRIDQAVADTAPLPHVDKERRQDDDDALDVVVELADVSGSSIVVASSGGDDQQGERHREKPAYFCLQTRSPARWDLISSLLAAVNSLELEVLDFRAYHPNDHFGQAHCVNEMYLRDASLALPPACDLPAPLRQALDRRVAVVGAAVRRALGSPPDKTEIKINRWLPGSELHAGRLRPASPARSHRSEPALAPASLGKRSRSEPVSAWARAWSSVDERLHCLESDSLAATFHVDERHELDGFIHTDAHRPFELPDDADHDLDDLLMGFSGGDHYDDDDETKAPDSGPLSPSSPAVRRAHHVTASRIQGCTLAVDLDAAQRFDDDPEDPSGDA